MSEENQRSWDWQASRYQQTHLRSRDTVYYWSEAYPNEDDLGLIGDVTGLKVLDLGSGACQAGIVLAKRGAIVTCSDLSQVQLDGGRAFALEDGVSLEFVQSDMQDLSAFPPDHFDVVVSFAAISYVEDHVKVFREVSRVLASGGRYVLSCAHGILLALGARFLWPEAKEDWSYYFRGPVRWCWEPGDPKERKFVTFRRTLEDYAMGLIKAGFQIEELLEPALIEARVPQDTFLDPDQVKFVKLYPQFALFSCRKVG